MSLLDKFKRKKFLIKEGHWLAVLRPQNAELALEEAHKLIGKEADVEFQELLTKQPYHFIGYAAAKPSACGLVGVLNGKGVRIDWLRPGDSLASGERFNPPECFA